MPLDNAVAPSLWRRLAAMFYDSWLVVAIWLLGATADFAIKLALGVPDAPVHFPLQLFLLLSPMLFFGWFWTHGGQTLGMRAWRLKLLTAGGDPVDWRQAMIRYAAVWLSFLALGLGYFWILVDRDRLAWHDRLSATRLVLTTKQPAG